MGPKITPPPEPKETPIYTVFFMTYDESIHRKEYIGNDHEDALKQGLAEPDCQDVLLIFIGSIPDAIWQG